MIWTGQALIGLLFVSLLAALVAAYRGRSDGLRLGLRVAFGLALAAAILLVVALVGHHFECDYVVKNTSRRLPVVYRVAALWAGQEGTILLWVILQLGVALSLARAEGARDATVIATAIVTGFTGLMLLRSPFAPVTGPVPADGHGLNPLLENPWMVVHPPVLFLGYACLVAPFALALAAFLRAEPDAWIERGRIYLLWGWVFLGAGMMLGGYWAYITLGWGGFWAWDPVENSSLIPWLAATALLHSLPLQKRCGAFRRMNYLLASATFALVVYGSYLTRSGVLGDFSVHSFESLGGSYNAGWLALLFGPLAVALAVLVTRGRQVAAAPLPQPLAGLGQGVWLLVIMTLFVLLGTSMPLLIKAFGTGQAVETSFYNRTQTVLFTVGVVLLALHLRPGASSLSWALLMGIGAIAWVGRLVAEHYPPGVRIALMALGAACGVMITLAVQRAWRAFQAGRRADAGYGLAHAGIALLVLGAVLSGPGERWQQLHLKPGESGEAVGATVAFASAEQTPDGKLRLRYQVERGGRTERGESLVYPTRNGQMRHPALFHRLSGDLYLEPEDVREGVAGKTITIAKGESAELDGLKLKFVEFAMGGSHGSGETMSVGAKLEVGAGGARQTVTPEFIVTPDGNESPPVKVGEHSIAVTKVMASDRSVELTIVSKSGEAAAGPTPNLVLRVTHKPWIGLVWLGTILTMLGGLVCLRRGAVGQG